jgi:hypothetical protein
LVKELGDSGRLFLFFEKGSFGEPSHEFAVLAEDLLNLPIKSRRILTRGQSRLQIKNVRGKRQIQASGFGFELPPEIRSRLKLDSFASGHQIHYRRRRRVGQVFSLQCISKLIRCELENRGLALFFSLCFCGRISIARPGFGPSLRRRVEGKSEKVEGVRGRRENRLGSYGVFPSPLLCSCFALGTFASRAGASG